VGQFGREFHTRIELFLFKHGCVFRLYPPRVFVEGLVLLHPPGAMLHTRVEQAGVLTAHEGNAYMHIKVVFGCSHEFALRSILGLRGYVVSV